MFKLTALSFIALGIAVGCSSSPVAPRSTVPTTSVALASSLADSMKPIEIPASLTLTAAATRCYCSDGWSFAMSPCNQTQCFNLCWHGHLHSSGSCH